MNIDLIHGAHHEWKVLVYLMQKIFPEYNIPSKEPWKKQIEPTNKHLIVSANLDCKKLKGYKKDGITYELREEDHIPILFYTGEPFDVNVVDLTGNHKYVIISSLKKIKQDNIYHIPFGVFWYTHFYLNNYLHKYRDNDTICIDNKYIIGYCATRETKERKEFMEKISNEINNENRILCLGRDNNYKCIVKKLPRTSNCNINVIHEYNTCKFVLCIENCSRKGYLTEKIICAFVSGAIPIYWGDHAYAKSLFNHKSFICIQDFQNFDECIAHILNMSDDDIIAMKKQPMFTNNIIPDVFNITDFSDGSYYGNFKKSIRNMVLD